MKKFYFILTAMVSVALTSCMNEEFVGNSPGTETANEGGVIAFGGETGNLTRTTSNTGTVAEMLDGQFKVYGVKKVSSTWKDAFKNYIVWDSNTKTLSNPDVATAGDENGWEYVGDATAWGGIANQTIKYWDYSASDYHFVAGSPASAFTFNLTSGDITSATVTGLGGHISANPGTPGTTAYYPVYIADPVVKTKANSDYNKEVSFSFKRQQTFVRVGVYETIPGYSISEIHFYEWNATATPAWKATAETSQNIILASKTANYFSGTTTSGAKATITYDWSGATPTYTFAYGAESGLTTSNNWYGGALDLSTSNKLATSSVEATATKLYGTDNDMAATGYFTVVPMGSAVEAQPIIIKCDYTLLADDGNGETINITGATAAIPAAFTKWAPNTTYTYLFKISDNTNGYTGPEGDGPEGLYPITFDAVVMAEADGMKQGIITSVSTPSITTYQQGSVTAAGVKYAKDKAIYFTAQNDETGELNALAALTTPLAVGMVQVYKLAGEATEADLILTRPADGIKFTTTVSTPSSDDWSINGQTIVKTKYASFTPDATGYYAIEYVTSVAGASPTYSYKIVKVE